MTDAPTKAVAAETSEGAEEEPDSNPKAQTKEEPEETVTVSDGRRRGRRRVMKKKTVQDEEGYLGMNESPNRTRSCADRTCSNTRRSRLGVFLRRGAGTQESKGVGRAHHCKDQEGCSKGTRKHHVILFQKMSTLSRYVGQ